MGHESYPHQAGMYWKSHASASDRTESPIFLAADINHILSNGEVFSCIQRKTGFGHKSTSAQVRCNSQMYKYILFVQGRGDKDVDGGNKTIPSDAANAMRHYGTAEGAKIFCATETDRNFMAPNSSNSRNFKLKELLNQQQLKSFMSQTRTKLLAAQTNIRKKEELALQIQQVFMLEIK
jgi:hypothetical protein